MGAFTQLGSLAHWRVCGKQVKQEDGDVCREAARVGLVWRLPSCLWRHPTPFRGKASALHLCPLADCPASHHPLLLLLVRKTAGSNLLTIYYGSSSSSSSISTLLKASDQPRLPPSPISLSTVTFQLLEYVLWVLVNLH